MVHKEVEHGIHEDGSKEEEEYLVTDITLNILKQLSSLGIKASIVDLDDMPDKQYYSYYFTSMPRVVTSVGYIKVDGMNFDYIHILGKG
jgi:hypothetical protein